MCSPSQPKLFHFHLVFGKNLSNSMLVPPSCVSTPFGKFWIQLCKVYDIACFEDHSANAEKSWHLTSGNNVRVTYFRENSNMFHKYLHTQCNHYIFQKFENSNLPIICCISSESLNILGAYSLPSYRPNLLQLCGVFVYMVKIVV